MPLTPELARTKNEICGYARAAGLDFFEVVFEVLDWNQMNVVASYGGFPSRYPHWRFGMEYEHVSKGYSYGLTKIYEMVINNDPCYAYLLHSNNLVDQKMVMAHVYAHSDFFKNNVYFAATNRKMIDEMGSHRSRVQRMVDRYGLEAVEGFIDCCLSLENLIDFRQVGLPHRKPRGVEEETEEGKKNPGHPERDLLLFLAEQAPLKRWEAEILLMIREEACYFAPQGETKIMNEGWAAYHHSRIMTERALKESEIIDYADHHSGTVAPQPGKLNPYKIGMELFRHIEEKWNRGKFGAEYEGCTDLKEKARWDRKLGLGRQKIFEVRRLHNDVTFLDTFLDEEFCQEQKLFTYSFNQATSTYEITDRDCRKVKAKLLQGLTNMGHPQMAVVDGNAFHRGELLLRHFHDGVDLRLDWAWETLKNIHRIWKKPVHLETIIDGVPKSLSFDGTEQKEQRLT